MPDRNFFKHWYIKICRYLFRRPFLPIMDGPLKGYLWSTERSYAYILGNYEEPGTMRLFLSWLQPGTVFYDIGANAGFHALTANSKIVTGKIYAFEPMPAMRHLLEKHISLNQKRMLHNNIHLSPLAIADTEKMVAFSNDIKQSDGNTYIKESYVYKTAANQIQVACKSIDGLVQEGYAPPDIIKIDVEGAEYDVLVGAKRTLEEHKPYILLATHDCHLPGVQEKCIQFLSGLGYQLQHTGKHNKYMDGLDDYIAIHKSKR